MTEFSLYLRVGLHSETEVDDIYSELSSELTRRGVIVVPGSNGHLHAHNGRMYLEFMRGECDKQSMVKSVIASVDLAKSIGFLTAFDLPIALACNADIVGRDYHVFLDPPLPVCPEGTMHDVTWADTVTLVTTAAKSACSPGYTEWSPWSNTISLPVVSVFPIETANGLFPVSLSKPYKLLVNGVAIRFSDTNTTYYRYDF